MLPPGADQHFLGSLATTEAYLGAIRRPASRSRRLALRCAYEDAPRRTLAECAGCAPLAEGPRVTHPWMRVRDRTDLLGVTLPSARIAGFLSAESQAIRPAYFHADADMAPQRNNGAVFSPTPFTMAGFPACKTGCLWITFSELTPRQRRSRLAPHGAVGSRRISAYGSLFPGMRGVRSYDAAQFAVPSSGRRIGDQPPAVARSVEAADMTAAGKLHLHHPVSRRWPSGLATIVPCRDFRGLGL